MFSTFVLAALSCAVLQPAESIELNVTRFPQDTFTGVDNCSLCAQFNQATCIKEGVCRCPRLASTFFIHKERCDSPAKLVKEQGCLYWYSNEAMYVVNLTSSSSATFLTPFSRCVVLPPTTFEYLGHQGDWTRYKSRDDHRIFSIERNNPQRMALKVSGNSDLKFLAGRIIRVDLRCKVFEEERNSCLIMKARGTISTTRGESPSQADMTTRQDIGTNARTVTKQSTSQKHYHIGTQNKPHTHFTPTGNFTVITLERINGAVTIDKTNNKGDRVVVAIISVLGAMACVLVISTVFAWLTIKYVKRFRRQDERNTISSLAFSNQVIQNAIPMSTRATCGQLPEPVYSELPDVVESANRIRSDTYASTSVSIDNKDAFFMVRSSLQYNTLPRIRKLTDPLPIPPLETTNPLDLQIIQKTTSDPNATKTAHFLSEVRKQLDVSTRKRSFTDVDNDNVFFENIPAKGLVVKLVENISCKPKNKSTQSFYQDLSETNTTGSRTSIYEPLKRSTLQPPNVRKTTLERIKSQEVTDDDPMCSQDHSAPEYHVLEPSTVNETFDERNKETREETREETPEETGDKSSSSKTKLVTLSVGADIKAPWAPPLTGYHVEQEPKTNQGCTSEEHDFDVEPSAANNERKQALQTGKMFKENLSIRPTDSQDSSWYSNGHRRTSQRNVLRRTKSLGT